MQISVNEWFKKNKDNLTELTKLKNDIEELRSQLNATLQIINDMQKEINIIKEGENI